MIIGQIGQPNMAEIDETDKIPVGWCKMQTEQPSEEHFNIDGEWKTPSEFIQ